MNDEFDKEWRSRFPNVQEQFERARAGKIEQQKTPEPPAQEKAHTTASYAQTVAPEPTNSPRQQASQNLQAQFARAATLKREQAATQQTQSGSEMVKNDRPAPRPAPPGLGRDADRQAHNERLAQERERATKLNESAKASLEAQKQLELKNERDKGDDDRSR